MGYREARLKVGRARRHIVEFEQSAASMIRPPSLKLEALQSPTSASLVDYVLRVLREPPEDLPLILGDALHNLRAALDHLAIAVVEANGGNGSGVYFPFGLNAAHLDQQISKKKFDRASADAVSLLRTIAPRKDGNAELRAIHDLDIADKHKLILEVAHNAGLPSLDLDFITQTYFRLPDGVPSFSPVVDGAMLFSGPPDRGFQIGSSVEVIAVFEFGPGSPLAGSRISSKLRELAGLVDQTIAQFEAL